jgi:methylmalonyl-CoA mutase C-terminal domain/subunit
LGVDITSKVKTKIIMAKFGLDGHSNGIRIVTRWLQDAGFEVIYMGLYNTAEGIIKAAQEENVDIIGCSFLEGAHLFYAKKLVTLADKKRLNQVKFVVGGVIPPDDINRLKKMGVKEVYTPGTPRDVIIAGLKAMAQNDASVPGK